MCLIFSNIYFTYLVCVSVLYFPLKVIGKNLTVLNDNENSSEGVINAETNDDDKCLLFMKLPHGNISVTNTNNIKTLHFSCLPGYHLTGPPKIICQTDEFLPSSDFFSKPTCSKGCEKPPMVLNAEVIINGEKDDNELFSDGVVAEYNCAPGYRLIPITSQHRVCTQGEWSGTPVTCFFEGCPRIKGILNGLVSLEKEPDLDDIIPKETTVEDIFVNNLSIKEGVIIHYKCNHGYFINGPSYAKCESSGIWQPHVLPRCRKNKLVNNKTVSSFPSDYYPIKPSSVAKDYFLPGNINSGCTPLPGPLIQTLSIQSITDGGSGQLPNIVPDGTEILVTCAYGYRDKRTPCIPQVLRCDEGNWQGEIPVCGKVENCLFPKIPHGEMESVSGTVGKERFGDALVKPGGQVTYTCLPGYQLTGESLFTCEAGGCWEPSILPTCEIQFYLNTSWPEYLNTNTSLLFSIITALSVLFVLLSVCVAVVCRHRPTPLHLHPSAPPPPPPALVPPAPDPDRVALIAFADDIQSGLPTYEEAIRGNGGGRGLLSYRFHHPPWSQRRNPRPDTTIVARQLSSTGESMGSTDTMTVSDVSTNVTLDTVSSHTCSSTSQTASCRAICGSLASFDTSSVLNTEGVPLLEENELEENGLNTDIDDNSVMPACDNTSFKLQSDIDSIHS